MNVSHVARLHGIQPSLLFKWKKQYLEGSLTAVAAGEEVVPASELTVNRPGFFGEFLVRKLRLPDHYLHWKHNRLFRLLPALCGLAVQVTFDY